MGEIHQLKAQTSYLLPSQEGEVDSLKLLSWNIYMLPPAIKFTGKRKRAHAIGEKLQHGDYDVIVFQEAFHAGARRIIKNKLKDMYPYRIGPAFHELFSLRVSSGIWILSKYPMRELSKVEFKDKAGFDNRMARKGALMVEVNKHGQHFQVIGTHLNTINFDVKASQLLQIKKDLVDKYGSEKIPLVIAGDFNMDKDDSKNLDTMLDILQVKDYSIDGPDKFTYDYTNNDLSIGKSRKTIDYVYFKPEKLRVRKVLRQIPDIKKRWSKAKKSLSDYNPVELLIYYKP